MKFVTRQRVWAGFVLTLQIAVTAAVYYGASRLGLMGATVGGISPFWPPTGVAVVALLLGGPRVAPGIVLGSLPLELQLHGVAPALASSGVDTLAPLVAYILLKRVGFRLALDRLRDALALVFLGGFAAMLVSSSIGTTILLVTDKISGSQFGLSWLVFWTGDTIGVLVVAPLLLALRNVSWLHQMGWRAWTEIALMLGLSILVAFVALRQFGTFFLAFPIIVWAALRYQLVGVTPCAFVFAMSTVGPAVHGTGPFVGQGPVQRLAELQIFNGSLVLGGLFFAVIITQSKRAKNDIEQTCIQLNEVIQHLAEQMNVTQQEEPPYVTSTKKAYRPPRSKPKGEHHPRE
jgi:integral membrane sensor domain MASE1